MRGYYSHHIVTVQSQHSDYIRSFAVYWRPTQPVRKILKCIIIIIITITRQNLRDCFPVCSNAKHCPVWEIKIYNHEIIHYFKRHCATSIFYSHGLSNGQCTEQSGKMNTYWWNHSFIPKALCYKYILFPRDSNTMHWAVREKMNTYSWNLSFISKALFPMSTPMPSTDQSGGKHNVNSLSTRPVVFTI